MKFIQPLILFLDDDLQKSAQMLTNQHLEKNISNCCQVMVCSILYTVGIRNRKACKFYFNKENKVESIQRFFPNWPLKNPPTFVKYNSQESRWCRKCKNHYDVILLYFEELLNEYSYRHGADHPLYEMLDFLRMAPYEISLRFGYKVIYIDNLKIILPWKSLPVKFRKKDIVLGYRKYYKSIILDPYAEYEGSRRDIPDFVLDGRGIDEFVDIPN